MFSIRVLAISFFCALFSIPLLQAQDLSRYREFQLGTNLLEVAKQADLKPSQVNLIFQRPSLIQDLEWRPQRFFTTTYQTDPVKGVLFSFCNGELYRMLINYDQHRTEGLTEQDMIGAISARYGTATRPVSTMIVFPSYHAYENSEKVIARWEDSQYSFNLFRSSYPPAFGTLVFSKSLDAGAQLAIDVAIRLDELEAPQREMERQKKQEEENLIALEKARPVNKANFRP
jgi:hypothetical protein